MNAAIFLDKDGTLVKDVPYNVDPRKQDLYPEVEPALAALARKGFILAVISNQPGVALGHFNEDALPGIKEALFASLSNSGVSMSGFYYCPHHPNGVREPYAVVCECRKPAPGLLRRAARELDIDLARSWMVGDILNDIEAGNRAGCRTILIDRGNETEWEYGEYRQPDYMTTDLVQAASFILNESSHRMEAM